MQPQGQEVSNRPCSDLPRCGHLQSQVSPQRFSCNGPSGDAGERLFERLFRVPGVPSPSECKVSGTASSRAIIEFVRGFFRLPFLPLSCDMLPVKMNSPIETYYSAAG